jgi:hypothetical protein
MPAKRSTTWLDEFRLTDRTPESFFQDIAALEALGANAPQPHAIRRAFERLKLSGVLCKEKIPLIYFRVVDSIDPNEISNLHRLFWNQGVAPLLVIVAPNEVHVYSGLIQPIDHNDSTAHTEALVEKLNRVPEALQRFIWAVEAGEYFHTHRKSFDPERRVDRNLLRDLKAARERLDTVPAQRIESHTLSALLCRLVFTCYLFDRDIIDATYLSEVADIKDVAHLRDILDRKPRNQAKSDLYRLFAQLGKNFNGDLFATDLDAEARQIKVDHLDVLNDFFHGTSSNSGQQSFWPYEFGIIPIETISAIYEHFLKAAGEQEKKEAGAFYTPRFLAEIVLDMLLVGTTSLLGKRFLDPACGSGIFLVGLFNRLAEEWDRKHPKAAYDTKLRALTEILKTNLYGIDRNRTACLIAAFSLYLALLDQLSPPDIRRVLKKVKMLPRLVGDQPGDNLPIRCADFFDVSASLPQNIHFIVGNPPWAQVKAVDSPAVLWTKKQLKPFPGKQLATAFVWKAPEHLEANGTVCFVLPHGILFNHAPKAIDFQRQWIKQHAVDWILNLADYQYFLFEDAKAPALVVRYSKSAPADNSHRIEYLSPKTDWSVTQAEVITVQPQDRRKLRLREVLDDLRSADAPMIWKEAYWATGRDQRLIDRLKLYPRLRDLIGKRGDREPKRWIIAEGFEPFGVNDSEKSRRSLTLRDAAKVEASTHALDLVLLPSDCDVQQSLRLDLRRGVSNPTIFQGPLVLVTEGFTQIAFAEFNVAYRHGIRGIHGPIADRSLLAFLTVYLRSAVGRHFLFHTSASWGLSRARIDVDDLLRLPFPLPDDTSNPERAKAILKNISKILTDTAASAASAVLGRAQAMDIAQRQAEPLVEEYLDIDNVERQLALDTAAVIMPSARPARTRLDVPTIRAATVVQRDTYAEVLCDTLNARAKTGYKIFAKTAGDGSLGIGVVVLEKTARDSQPSSSPLPNVLDVLNQLQSHSKTRYGTLELTRGLKVFDGDLLYITKPLGQRFWTATAAFNDADEIANTIFERSLRGTT